MTLPWAALIIVFFLRKYGFTAGEQFTEGFDAFFTRRLLQYSFTEKLVFFLHTPRLVSFVPALILHKLSTLSIDQAFTIYGLCILLGVIWLHAEFKKKPSKNSVFMVFLISSTYCGTSAFMNGRMIFSIFAAVLVLRMAHERFRKLSTFSLLMAFIFSSVSTGTLLVTLTFLLLQIFHQKRQSAISPSSKFLICIWVFFAVSGLIKNLAFFLDSPDVLAELVDHGITGIFSGRPAAQMAIFITMALAVAVGMVGYLFSHRIKMAARFYQPQSMAFFLSIIAGLFGRATFFSFFIPTTTAFLIRHFTFDRALSFKK